MYALYCMYLYIVRMHCVQINKQVTFTRSSKWMEANYLTLNTKN